MKMPILDYRSAKEACFGDSFSLWFFEMELGGH